MARRKVEGRGSHQSLPPFVLVETLLERRAEGDLPEAQVAIDRLANLCDDQGSAIREITLLRLRALLSRARGDDVSYRDLVSRYRAMAESLGFEGHISMAEAMIEGGELSTRMQRPSCQLARSTSTVSSRRAWIRGYTAAVRTIMNTAATPVRSANGTTPQSIVKP